MEAQTSPDRLFWLFAVLLYFVALAACWAVAIRVLFGEKPVVDSTDDKKNEPPQWPEGSMQWAERRALDLGLVYVRRRAWEGRQHTGPMFDFYGLTPSDRHALDWEPCK